MVNYNLEEIITKQSDEEQYQTLTNSYLLLENKEIAKKILLNKKIIKKDEYGKYEYHIVDESVMTQFFDFIYNHNEEQSLHKLKQLDINESTSIKLIEFYKTWKKLQNQKRLKWNIILPVSFLISFITEYFFRSPILIWVWVIPLYFYNATSVSSKQFKKNKIFKVFED